MKWPRLEQVVQLDHEGRRFTFRVDRRPPAAFWRVESEGKVYRSPLTVTGNEQPEFFRSLAQSAIDNGEL